jgi:hypothetical protein
MCNPNKEHLQRSIAKSQHVITAPKLRHGQTCLTSLLKVAENSNACLGNVRLSGRNVRILLESLVEEPIRLIINDSPHVRELRR